MRSSQPLPGPSREVRADRLAVARAVHALDPEALVQRLVLRAVPAELVRGVLLRLALVGEPRVDVEPERGGRPGTDELQEPARQPGAAPAAVDVVELHGGV